MSNPFETITEIYKDQTEELDKHGYADKFKQGTELFFKGINDDILSDDSKFHFEDIEYLDGYFIFSHGTNSVVHFHIKECPGWKFGIWWEMPNEKEDSGKLIKGECFAQYEEEIDKFKPSASEIRASVTASAGTIVKYTCHYEALKMFEFIRQEPYLAFCRHLYGWNYNQNYYTREEAEAIYREYRLQKSNETKYTPIFNKRVIDFVEQKILPYFKCAEIVDEGLGVSPRYKIIAPYSKYTDVVEKPGFYSWFDYDDKKGKALEKELESIEQECKRAAKTMKFWWISPIDRSVYFYEKSANRGDPH